MTRELLSPLECHRWTRIGALCALSLLLGYLETFVPIPLPGVKLGLANIPVLVALDDHDVRGACWVGAVKVVAAGLLFGNPMTLAYSAVGTSLALVLMGPLSLLPTMRLEMISVIGALAHEAGQLLVAQLLLGTSLVWYSAPLLAVAGCATGLLSGIVARKVADLLRQGDVDDLPHATEAHKAQAPAAPVGRAMARFATYLCFVATVMHASRLAVLGGCLVVGVAAALLARVAPRTLGKTLLAAFPIALVAFIAQLASAPGGEALVASGGMLVRLLSISAASLAVVAGSGRHDLACVAHLLLRPLSALGLDLQGPELAMATTIRLLPLLADLMERDLRPHDLWSRSFWTERLPALVRELYQQVLSLA